MALFFSFVFLFAFFVFARPPVEFVRLNNPPFTLIVFAGPVSWSTAEEACRANGMSIASIHNAEENGKIIALLKSVTWPDKVWHGAWIGLTDEESEGKWRWVDGSPLDFTNFGPGEPNGGTYENYGAIELARAGRPDGWWNDAYKNEKYSAVVCRAGGVAKVPKASTSPTMTTPLHNAPSAKEDVFYYPTINGYRLDWCYSWGSKCGKDAADAFCRRKGFSHAKAWEIDPDIGNRFSTYVISTGQICNQSFCDGFKWIKCTAETSADILSEMEPDTDRPGMDYKSFDLTYADPKLCMEACNKDPRCKAWTYVKPNTIQGPRPKCWLKHSIPPPKTHYCCVSGVKRGTSAAPARPTVNVGKLAMLLYKQGIRGGQFYSTGKPVKVTILPSDAGYTSELWLVSPVEKYIGTNRESWKNVELGVFPTGTELVFELRVKNTGHRFRTGPASRNPDSLIHAALYSLEPGKVVFGFEDLLGGGDRDFNDCMFLIEGVNLTPLKAKLPPVPKAQVTATPHSMPQTSTPLPVMRTMPVKRYSNMKCIESVGVGEASVIGDDRSGAKVEATARAKWDAIEKALGVTTSVKTILHNFALLDEVIKNEVGGFIRDVKVLSVDNFQDMVRVKVKGCVYPKEAERALSLISSDTSFSVMIVTKNPGSVVLGEMNPVTTELVNILNQQGFRVYDFAGNPNVNPYDIENIIAQRRFIALRAYMSRVLSGAMIVGKVELIPSTQMGQDIGYGIKSSFNVVTARLNYYLLTRDNQGLRIVASGSVSALGRALNQRDAEYKAMEALAKRVGADIMGKIERYRASKSKLVTVTVKGVRSTKTNFRIKEKLQRVPWVESVEDAGLGKFRVKYLENTVYLANAVERIPELRLISFNATEIVAKYR